MVHCGFLEHQVWTPVLIAGAQAASAQRLQDMKKILTLAPQRIAVCGKVRVVCFDKTGTLTQQGMQFAGAAVGACPAECTRATVYSRTRREGSPVGSELDGWEDSVWRSVIDSGISRGEGQLLPLRLGACIRVAR